MNRWHKALAGLVAIFAFSIVLSLIKGEYRNAGFQAITVFVLLGTWVVLEIVFENRPGG